MDNLSRREAIKRAALLSGYAVSASVISGVMQGCQPANPGAADWQPKFFTADEGKMVTAMAETILPATDTPGAADVGVHQYIDIMVKDCFKPEEQEAFRAGLTEMAEESKSTYGKDFAKLSAEQQLEMLGKANQAAEASAKDPGRPAGPPPFFATFKQLVLVGYFTSKEVGMEVLAYDPVPDAYNGCVSLEETTGGRNWAPNR